ncbi:hypothetical protein L313_0526 [Acinetobacter haemolyticus CIP 64.3 = MTCC 9819]|uniref:Uncharacterized protein n=1 Tax=Acinetobacter haemolyticus CIP 64.3 = MTCC 9819 TaxID=1217659 RepID=N9FBV0_ACIHA|nr:hypothetical protein [Acinetobacter haemolyticus]ENW20298.1 hypothetical protein F927_00782 [Acinetobacter haemolyticus CIP 64.3 = MTCC 9819]EPR87634.1 hypothetical protein L313_0526 [Acinetobacter haemolyticus CIP 64.3 = MTCC 9819]QXZ27750.1 hypothetical protein I6L22_05580 [Acinetobacter haemolyticus]SPT47312.1 Uncharacterised protein [Acinetobacter haemolyticus]SUU54417.1 Uncharacterised protein [Acinetobacter haemolyticus]
MKHKFIDVKEMKVIESILNKWSGKLTWDLFAVSVARALDKPSISKFTLMSYEPVKQAFNLRKKTLREAKSTIIASMADVTIDMLIKENEELRNQISHLKKLLEEKESLWVDQYRRWQYNLSQMPNVDLATLDRPLVKK